MSLVVTILGCGTSTGVPRVDGEWGACDPSNPRNRRRRCSVLVERRDADKATTVLIDTSPDLREQLLEARVRGVDAVLYTHDHADHTHGIDDLRILAYRMKKRVDVYATEFTAGVLRKRFDYCFAAQPGSSYPPILKLHLIRPGEAFEVHGAGGALRILPYAQDHGEIASLGFRIGGFAYSSDVVDFPAETPPLLRNLDLLVIDALRPLPHPSHFNVEQALGWIETLRPKRALLTHMHMDLDYETLRGQLPEGVEPAYDGLRIELS
jgi:phosphoribosyl 1,2-cyclic phosphate phosphodiesterase